MTGGASKIPPHIARELRRHIKPKAGAARQSNASSSSTSSSNNGKLYTFLGCTAFIGVTASFPYFGMAWIGPLNERDGVRRRLNNVAFDRASFMTYFFMIDAFICK